MRRSPVFVLVMLAFGFAIAVSAKSPRRSPTPRPSAAETALSPGPPSPERVAPASAPVPRPTPEVLPSPREALTPNAAAAPAGPADGPPPKPMLYLLFTEPFTAGGKNWIRYRYDVLNKNEYPAEMFAPAPALPPCGSNTNSSRTWVDFFDSTGKRLYGFCALGSPADLGKIWIAFEEGVVPPSYVYIELNDRQTNTKLKSNLADTTL
ncbi:MAG TPA: hypothetical protein VJS88_02405 [Chthoniobacterales bacterium]|nr:hypothetical protein [Chthoniobacterales bacterium]